MKDFPSEILANILGRLVEDEKDLWSVSGVCRRWYQVLNLHVLPRLGKLVYRRGYPLPAAPRSCSPTTAHIVNFIDPAPVLPVLSEGVTELHIGFDKKRGTVESTFFESVLKKCSNLKKLVINKTYLTTSHLKEILEYFPLSLESLQIFLDNEADIKKEALRFLKENREIFKEVLIIWEFSKPTITGAYPNIFQIIEIKWPVNFTSLSLECRGLTKLNLTKICSLHHLKELELMEASNINSTILILFSKLQLEKLLLTGVQCVSTTDWITAFSKGFSKLHTLTLDNCYNISNNLVWCLPVNLKNLTLDFTHSIKVSPIGYVGLYVLDSLETLTLRFIYDINLVYILTNGVQLRWKKLISLNINVHPLLDSMEKFPELENDLVKSNLKTYCKLKSVLLEYNCVLTKYLATIQTGNKND